MSGRGQEVEAIILNRIAMCLLACLTVLGVTLNTGSMARADVDTRGELRAISPILSAPGEVKPLVSTENEDYECTAKYSDIQSGAFTWVIGNCPQGSILEAVVRRAHTESEPENYSLGGWVGGSFQGCGWIEDQKFKPKAKKSKPTTACTEIASGKYEVAEANFISKHNSGAGDGYYVVNKTACPEYANYRPWSSSNLEQEKLRTAPAYASQEPGSNVPALKWRYTTKYNSTDGTGQYVMVRDASVAAGEGNWVFVPRSCLPSNLPENENERLPPPPTVSTDGASDVGTATATLNAAVNPNGFDTKYFFEYGTTTGYGSYTSTGDAGAGTSAVPVAAEITGLAPYTTYYFRIVASSAIGEVFGGPVGFTTQALPPEATTSAASEIQSTQAKLNGTVNPNGPDTHYDFEYGPTAAYGSSTPEVDAGSGMSAIPVGITATNLRQSTFYHYRLVAKSNGGTRYGADHTFSTVDQPAADVIAQSGSTSLYYDSTGSLEDSWFNGTEWHESGIPDSASITGNPFVIQNSATSIYYASNGSLEDSWFDGKEWHESGMPDSLSITGDPFVIQTESATSIYYNSQNMLEDSWFDGKEWHESGIPDSLSITGDPFVVQSESGASIYYNSNGVLEDSWFDGKEWHESAVPSSHAISSDPFVIQTKSGSSIYYNSNGSLEDSWFDGKEWHESGIPGSLSITGDPFVIQGSSTSIYYDSSTALEDSWFDGKEWHESGIPGSLPIT